MAFPPVNEPNDMPPISLPLRRRTSHPLAMLFQSMPCLDFALSPARPLLPSSSLHSLLTCALRKLCCEGRRSPAHPWNARV